MTDVDGNEYVDYLMGLGPLLFGHRPPEITAAVVTAVQELGTVFGLPYELEAVAARKVIDAVPSVDMVRFASSGSEAVGTAVRLARAVTDRKLILRFEGHYHGWMDTVYWSNHPDPSVAGPATRPVPVAAGRGMLPEIADSLVMLSWNDPESFEAVMAELGDQIAAVITEPVMLNTGCILPEDGFLQLLRDRTREHGALLIFDEVITGFRFARGGGQEFFGVMPDITTMAKGLGGGFPVAAIGGTREVMAAIGDGRYSHSGTYNSNVIQMAAVSATMDLLSPARYDEARALGAVADGRAHGAARREGRAVARRRARHRVPGVVHGRAGPQLARRRAPDRRGAVRPVVEGDARPRRAVPPGAVREPVRVDGAHVARTSTRTLEAAEGALGAL